MCKKCIFLEEDQLRIGIGHKLSVAGMTHNFTKSSKCISWTKYIFLQKVEFQMTAAAKNGLGVANLNL